MPSPITAFDLISTAFRKLGVLAAGETLPASEAETGLQALNDVIETWNIEGLSLVNTLPSTFNTIVGQSTYTLGIGGDWNDDRPAQVTSAYCTVNGVDFPIDQWSLERWMDQSIKTLQTQIVNRYVFVNEYPLAKVILWPTPMVVIPVTLNYNQIIGQVSGLATSLNLAPGYARALQYAVAVELQPEFGGQDVSAYARATKAVIKGANITRRTANFDTSLMMRPRVIPARGY